jgi:hypothetical protein
VRYFKEFRWQTRRSWSRERRVVAKADFTGEEANPRFVVSLKRTACKRAATGPKRNGASAPARPAKLRG